MGIFDEQIAPTPLPYPVADETFGTGFGTGLEGIGYNPKTNLIELLREYMGPDAPSRFGDITSISKENIATALQRFFDIDPQDLPPSLFSKFNEAMLKPTEMQTYAAPFAAKGKSLFRSLIDERSPRSYGNIAGSGGITKKEQGIRDAYGQIMGQEYAKNVSSSFKAVESLEDLFASFVGQAQKMKGYST